MIRIQDVSKSFDDKEVIHKLNLEIDSGSFTTLLGPSGCGKTTLLRMIAGFEQPSEGEIYFNDQCIFSKQKNIDVSPEDRMLGFVFQDFALWPHLTVYENVAFSLRARGDTIQLDERVKKALSTVQLDHLSQQHPGQLSGGQQQRVAFARAIVGNPSIILFDEPFSALDAILRDGMRIELKQLAEEYGFTSIFVTHDQIEAMTMSDKIAVLSNGYLEQYDQPEQIYQSPTTQFVANFIGYSNWVDDNHLFRPESASVDPVPNSHKFSTSVVGSEYVGSNYKMLLKHNNQDWTINLPYRIERDSALDLYVSEEDVIKI